MPTVAETRTLLSRYAGAGNTFIERLNLVRARLLQAGSYPGTKQPITLEVYSDASGNSIVTLPRQYKTILAGAVQNPNVLCSGMPLGIRNMFEEFNPTGLGYGGLGNNFVEVPGRYSVFQEWASPMRIRLKFEVTEASGTIYLSGTLDGEDVWALNGAAWEKREAIAFSGTTAVTSTKYYDAVGFKVKKPVTNGRVFAYAVDADGAETPIAVWEPSETLPRYKRYKVPDCADVHPVESTRPVTPSQFYTKDELDAMFADAGTITVNSTVTHDLVYAAYFLRRVRVVAQAGSGAYVASFLLDNSTVKPGGVLRVAVEIAASANPTLRFYDNTTASLLQEIAGDSSNATYTTFVFTYDGANWAFSGREL